MKVELPVNDHTFHEEQLLETVWITGISRVSQSAKTTHFARKTIIPPWSGGSIE